MAVKAVLLFCAQALLAQTISSQCIGTYPTIPYIAEPAWGPAPCAANPWATPDWLTGYGPATLPTSNGGGFQITSVSPIAVTGISMTSENAYEGLLSVAGTVPFLGAVALEGALPTAGSGAIAYGCGNGNVAMLTEDISPGPYAYGPGIAAAELGYGYPPLVYEAPIAGPIYGCGCGYGPIF